MSDIKSDTWLGDYRDTVRRIDRGDVPSAYFHKEFERLRQTANDVKNLRTECGDEGNLIDVIELGKRRGRVEKPSQPRRLKDFTGYAFFTLGPVYTWCNVDRDMIEAFRELTTPDAHVRTFDPPRLALQFRKPILETCNNAWDYYLEAVSLEYIQQLKDLVTTQRFRVHDPADVKKTTYWGADVVDRIIPDPIAIERNDYTEGTGKDDCMIHVFLPSGNVHRIGISPMSTLPVRLVRRPPDKAIVLEAKTLLQVST